MSGNQSVLTAVSSLEDPVRARLYQIVSASPEPTGRDQAAAAAGIGRPLAAYHLDRLVDLGLLTATYQRPAGRSGPGAGRPAKLYSRSGQEFAVTVPPREYELAARLLAVAVDDDSTGCSRSALQQAARRYGASLASHSAPAASAGQTVQTALAGHGFEPWRDETGTIRLRNCPFHQLVKLHPHLICGMTLALIDGLIDGLGAPGLRAALDPAKGQCCVTITTENPTGDTTTGWS
ncbi:MAG TPA: transcriptional regulator [Streptosporangiaceae bacterium]|nr:transcriptional regulator [Streptosporangiaceae bacterium]